MSGVAKLLPTEEDDDAADAAASAPAAALSAIALALADVRHAHLVRVLGCRTEPPRRFVVVERALGSLHDVVHNGKVRALAGAPSGGPPRRGADGAPPRPRPPPQPALGEPDGLRPPPHQSERRALRPAWAALGSKARRAEVAVVRAGAVIATSGEGYDRPMLGGASSERRRASDTLHPVSAKSDVYSFAMTAYEVILREKPFAGTSDVRWLAVESRDRPPVPLPLERDEAAGPLIALMKRCWAHFPAERPTFVAICTELEARVAADEEASNEVRDDDPTRTLSFQRDQLLRSRAAVGPPDPPARRASAAGRRASAAGRRASAATATGATDGGARWRRGVGKLKGAAALAAATRMAPAAAARAERDGAEPSVGPVAAVEAAAAGGGKRRRKKKAAAPAEGSVAAAAAAAAARVGARRGSTAAELAERRRGSTAWGAAAELVRLEGALPADASPEQRRQHLRAQIAEAAQALTDAQFAERSRSPSPVRAAAATRVAAAPAYAPAPAPRRRAAA